MKIYKTATGKSVVVSQQAVLKAKITINGINATSKSSNTSFKEPSGVLIGKPNLSNKLRVQNTIETVSKISKKIA